MKTSSPIWRRAELHLAALQHRLTSLDARITGPTPASRDIRRERAALRWVLAIVHLRAPEDAPMPTPPALARVTFERVFSPPAPPIARRAEDRPPRRRTRADE